MDGFPLNQTSLSFLDRVSSNSEIGGWPNTFVTGTFEKERAVSIQQLRAGTLALALAARYQHRCHVAVVGAGFSGVALSTILLKCGFQVDQFEQSEQPISAHAGSSKTYVHPNLHNWPDEPFLQHEFKIGDIAWNANVVSRVSDQVSQQYMALAKSKRSKLRTFFGQRVRSIHRAEAQGGSIRYRLVTDADVRGKIYDVVVFAVGFGWESVSPTVSMGYWHEFDAESTGTSDDPERTLFSGKGDRALIDLLRSSLKNYEPGRVFDVFPQLCDDDLRTRVRNIERMARLPESQADIFEEYRKLFSDKVWTESIRQFGVNQTRRVFFNARPPGIFNLRSSVLNRVLVYFLVKEGIVELRPYEMPESIIHGSQEDGRIRYSLHWDDGRDIEVFDKIILRHGIKEDYFWRSFPELRGWKPSTAGPDEPVEIWSVSDLPPEILHALQSGSGRRPVVAGVGLLE